MTRSTSRPATRTVLIGICGLAVALLFSAVVRQTWTANAAAAEVVELESDGVQMLHPLTSLLSELVDAQSAAVRGERINEDSVRTALQKVNDPNGEYGAALRTNQRLSDLTSEIETAFSRAGTGRAAYETYSSLVT